ncbi:rhodanese-like domain-containing protein [Cochlodiniinecator piscidefendens]|uniref:rhodanese-like domain-containing protein n=1 Tax=Cochlodiniinecator piscidefendens TaxID=2715756 RepID=UPI00140C07B2|nr:rhodanese-like domain-containing protein [Cochlodiniinecator piscidefendens]
MSTDNHVRRVTEVSPDDTWTALETDVTAVLIDVRTKAEWSFVGIPDLSDLGRSTLFIEWAEFPTMTPNAQFVDTVLDAVGDTPPAKIFFLCRSGVRSLYAADAVSDAFAARGESVECINVAEGFEGDLNAEKHRGQQNGWKSRGLAWRQS